MGDQDKPEGTAEIDISETTWIEGISAVHAQRQPNGMVIISFILRNGHRYTIPMQGEVLRIVHQSTSLVEIASAMPPQSPNGRAI